AVDKVPARRFARLGAELTIAEPSDQRCMARQDAQLAVVDRQGDEVHQLVEPGLLWRHHHTLEPPGAVLEHLLVADRLDMTGHRLVLGPWSLVLGGLSVTAGRAHRPSGLQHPTKD